MRRNVCHALGFLSDLDQATFRAKLLKALKALETSLSATSIRLSMALVDGDLKPLRQLDQWPAWVERMTSAAEDEGADEEGAER